jgi:hypothetical protein
MRRDSTCSHPPAVASLKAGCSMPLAPQTHEPEVHTKYSWKLLRVTVRVNAWQRIRGDSAAERMGYEIGILLTTIRWSESVLYLLIRDSNRCLALQEVT